MKNIVFVVKRFIRTVIMIFLVFVICHLLLKSRPEDTKNPKRWMTINFSKETSTHPSFTTTDFMTTTDEITTTENATDIIYRYSFKYLHLPPGICEVNGAKSDPFLIIAVKSSVLNIGYREAIRLTWGKLKNESVKIVFLLGYSSLIDQYITIESKLYQDIIQQDFIDDYWNNTLKTIMGFDWIVSNCAKSKYVYFVDDDYFVNLPKILEYLDWNIRVKTKNLIAGYKYVGAIPRRKRDSKWYVSMEDYPNKTWPPYLSGGSMIMDISVAKRIQEEIPYTKPLHIDDVFLGIVAQSLQLELWNERRFSVYYHADRLGNIFAAHRFGPPHRLISEWKRVRCNHKALFRQLYGELQC